MPQLPTLDELKISVTRSASKLSPEAEHDDQRLHGAKPPQYSLSEEKPWMRAAAYMFATGCVTTKEVAAACDMGETTVRNLLRQDWFQERVTQLMAAYGGKDILAMFRAEQFRTFTVMLDLRDSKSTPAPVKYNICRDILDRTLGKPIQRIETNEPVGSDDPVAEARRLEEELQRTRS